MAEKEKWLIGVEKPEDIRICVYTILKNEMKFIDRFLASVKDACGIYLLDTGSTDGSYEYLCELAEKPEWKEKLFVDQKIITPWHFGNARTENMKMIPPTEEGGPHYCFQVDLDEVLTEGWLSDFQKVAFEHPEAERLTYLYAWNHDENGNPKRIFVYNKFHHNSPHYITKGYVHEWVEWLDEDGKYPCPYHGYVQVSDTKIYKHHYPDQTKSRGSYLGLLEKRTEEYPDDLNTYAYLWREYTFVGEWEKALTVATRLYFKAIKLNQGSNDLMTNTAMGIADMYNRLGLGKEAEFFYKRAIEFEPRLKDNYMKYAQFLAYHGRSLEAIEQLRISKEKCVKLHDWREVDYYWKPWKEHQIRADAYCWLGDYALAWEEINRGKDSMTCNDDKTEAGWEGFWSDYSFIEEKYKTLHPEEFLEEN